MLGAILASCIQSLRIIASSISASDNQTNPTGAVVSVALDANGVLSVTEFFTNTNSDYCIPVYTGVGSRLWVKYNGSGTAPSGSALNTWLQLSSTRSWSLSQSGIGFKQYTGTLSFSLDGGTTTFYSTSLDLYVQVDP